MSTINVILVWPEMGGGRLPLEIKVDLELFLLLVLRTK